MIGKHDHDTKEEASGAPTMHGEIVVIEKITPWRGTGCKWERVEPVDDQQGTGEIK